MMSYVKRLTKKKKGGRMVRGREGRKKKKSESSN